ncbi:MAG TPA: DUF1405 domain-containing protein [Candidatus Thermoplasmatota archaeon]|nr:DUF1405 domain-containing protein [Candidatus Thermoplasmatota archaeon]
MPGEAAMRLLRRVRGDGRFLAPILIANLAGIVFGWYYYWDVGQFDPSSPYYQEPWWWPLVADSPNAVLLFFVAMVAHRLKGWRSKGLDAAAFTLNIYVGLWTSALFLLYPERMGTFDWGSTNNILFFSHMGMPLQALLLLPEMRGDRWSWIGRAAVVAALALFVGVDYWGPLLHPAPFLHPGDAALHRLSPWLMAVAAGAWLAAVHWAGGRSRSEMK